MGSIFAPGLVTPAGATNSPQLENARDVRLPVLNYMPPEAVEFCAVTYAALPAIGGSVVVAQLIVEPGYNGVINFFGNEFVGGGFNAGTGNLYWTLYQDATPNPPIVVPNFQKILASLGTVQAPSRMNGIRIKQNQLVELVAFNVGIAPAGQQLGGRLQGYFYPIDLEPGGISF